MSERKRKSSEKKYDKFKHSSVAQNKNKGEPRKGGTKGWGTIDDELRGVKLDPRDPLYDSEDDKDIVFVEFDAQEIMPSTEKSNEFNSGMENLGLFKREIRMATKEYLQSSDREEFLRCINEIDMSIFHSEIPKEIMKSVMAEAEELRKKTSSLLQYLHEHNVLTKSQMEHGFKQLYNCLNDIKLDVPDADTRFKAFINRGVAAEFLDESVANQLLQGIDTLAKSDDILRLKTKIKELLREYFDSEDLAECAVQISELNATFMHHEIVKQAISLSCDGSNRERELTSFLISSLSYSELDGMEVERGFEILLGRVEDLYRDVPKILEYLSHFLARAIFDEAVAPAFLSRVNILPNDMGSHVIHQVEVLRRKPHSASHLSKVWGDNMSVPAMKKSVKGLVKEYFQSKDINEANRCVRELSAPYFHHEVVKRFVTIAITIDTNDAIESVIKVLQTFAKEGLVSSNQLECGLNRVEIEDLKLDVPNAPKGFQQIKDALNK